MSLAKTVIPFVIVIFVILSSCSNLGSEQDQTRFRLLDSDFTGIHFNNKLTESDTLNYFTYQYMYMGGGVAIGDVNNDGLSDVFFTGNMVENKLYLNQGDLRFKDISKEAGLAGDSRWYTGVTFIDINSDGYLDIYLSVSGKNGSKHNQLYINNQDLTFSEKASEYGIDDGGQSIQSAFFDYDHDGDLDLFVINYPIISFKTPNTVYRMLKDAADIKNSDHLYRNDGNGKFTDVTNDSGLLNFGLSVSSSIGDFNQDGWDDIYVSNDFSTPDYLYMNNGDGTFTDRLRESTKQTSFYGMGTDAEDFNNDGLLDLFQVDMAARDNRRSKANMASMDPGLFWSTVNNGFHYQYMYNAFQLNQGIDESGLPIFSNVNWMSGVASTDWSWAPIAADFDNDGWKDLFITNGTRREINNKDFFKNLEKEKNKGMESPLIEQIQKMPSEEIDNYVFKNIGGFGFKKANEDWGLSYKGFSNGTAYGDLDNDGDLDLILNNIDDMAVLFENRTSQMKDAHYVKVKLEGDELNLLGIGAKLTLVAGESRQYIHLNPSKGFQSYVEPILHFGLGNNVRIDSLIVDWVDGTTDYMVNLNADQTIAFKKGSYPVIGRNMKRPPQMYQSARALFDSIFDHKENRFDDFDKQVLLPHKLSNLGPALATGDVNSDGLDDIFVGNGAGFAAAMYLQQPDGRFILTKGAWQEDARYEDIGAVFFDANNDGQLDLYVVSGGNSPQDYRMFQDRLYINVDGILTKSQNILPKISGSGSRVIPKDFDGDGDVDLFVGGRISPQNYPFPGQSYLLVNQMMQGELKFVDQTEELAPGLSNIGMVTDAMWTDYDQNGTIDLIAVGEWMPITIFSQENGIFKNKTVVLENGDTSGWWFSIDGADFDNDGDIDLIAGNLGTNYKYQASEKESFNIYASDFDENGSKDLVLGYYNNGVEYPVRGRQCSSQQIPAIQLKFKDYSSFANATIEDVYGSENLSASLHYKVTSFASVYLENLGNGEYKKRELPFSAQISPINDILIEDFNADGSLDLLVGGDLYAAEVETPRSDAGIGLLMLGDGHGEFQPLPYSTSGINMGYDVKALGIIKNAGRSVIVTANNQGPLQLFAPFTKSQSKMSINKLDNRTTRFKKAGALNEQLLVTDN